MPIDEVEKPAEEEYAINLVSTNAEEAVIEGEQPSGFRPEIQEPLSIRKTQGCQSCASK